MPRRRAPPLRPREVINLKLRHPCSTVTDWCVLAGEDQAYLEHEFYSRGHSTWAVIDLCARRVQEREAAGDLCLLQKK